MLKVLLVMLVSVNLFGLNDNICEAIFESKELKPLVQQSSERLNRYEDLQEKLFSISNKILELTSEMNKLAAQLNNWKSKIFGMNVKMYDEYKELEHNLKSLLDSERSIRHEMDMIAQVSENLKIEAIERSKEILNKKKVIKAEIELSLTEFELSIYEIKSVIQNLVSSLNSSNNEKEFKVINENGQSQLKTLRYVIVEKELIRRMLDAFDYIDVAILQRKEFNNYIDRIESIFTENLTDKSEINELAIRKISYFANKIEPFNKNEIVDSFLHQSLDEAIIRYREEVDFE